MSMTAEQIAAMNANRNLTPEQRAAMLNMAAGHTTLTAAQIEALPKGENCYRGGQPSGTLAPAVKLPNGTWRCSLGDSAVFTSAQNLELHHQYAHKI